ncbi:MAG: right-handed parallel beta-helix repeat-containing protein [Planctomycetota bacterium]
MQAAAIETLEPRRLLTTWHVAPWGNDGNWGDNVGQPLATLERAGFRAQPGDTILLRGGTYTWTSDQWVGSNGTASAWITIDNYGNEKPIIDASNLVPNNSIGANDGITIGGSFVEIRDLEIKNAPDDGIEVWSGHDVRIRNLTTHHNGGAGISARAPEFAYSTYNVLIEGNTVYRNARANIATPDEGAWPAAMIAHFANNVTFRDNTVYENYGEGIIQAVSSNGKIEGNTVRDNYSINIYLDNAVNIDVERNFAYHTGKGEFYRFGSPAIGIAVANEGYARTQQSRDNTIVNNLVKGGRHAFYVGSFGWTGGLVDSLVAHNTFRDAWGDVVKLDASPEHRNSTFANNIVEQYGGNERIASWDNAWQNGAWMTLKNNLWAGGNWSISGLWGSNDVWGWAGFAGGSNDVNGYKLTSGSPAINAAAWGYANTDFAGSSRVGTPDIGAWEFGGALSLMATGKPRLFSESPLRLLETRERSLFA